MTVQLPDGHCLGFGHAECGLKEARVEVLRWRGLLSLALNGQLGAAEAYVAGDWRSPDLAAVFAVITANAEALASPLAGTGASRLLSRWQHRRNANTRAGSKRNIEAHYDLGNAFYRQWLDPSLFYSSALFTHAQQTLTEAQAAKARRIIDLAEIQDGDRVLEIGCGWGSFAEALLDTKECTLRGITLSREQLAQSRARLAGRNARFELTDYRDITGSYDAVVSIEMLEAVGAENWPTYFRVLKDRLRPGGTAVIQVITIADDRFDGYRRRADFIQKHVFPGGMLPSPQVLRDQIAAAGLHLDHVEFFGASYARTLRHWHQSFEDAWPRIEPLGFDARFRRLWRYYLLSCAAGFDAGIIDVGLFQIRL
ncbi:MAG: class I SAM-dependent methyltransferase [Magnetospiraceae bacterium]